MGQGFFWPGLICFWAWTSLSGLQWFSQPESQLTEVWFTYTESHRTSSKGFLYNITIGPLVSLTLAQFRSCPQLASGRHNWPLRYQLGGKTLQVQGAISGCGMHFNQWPPYGAEILVPKSEDTSTRECSKSPRRLPEIACPDQSLCCQSCGPWSPRDYGLGPHNGGRGRKICVGPRRTLGVSLLFPFQFQL